MNGFKIYVRDRMDRTCKRLYGEGKADKMVTEREELHITPRFLAEYLGKLGRH